ncbi:MAG: DUF1294 domain-containing protein [Gammaproteobacteria bacterium]|nr:DUF1294 domain-containing protein [Gammaproteobacteria bacterium]
MRSKGRLTSWNDDKGFGFITPLAGGERIFVHVSAFRNRSRRPSIDQIVTYTPSTDKKGRACAIKATLTGNRLAKLSLADKASMPTKTAVAFLVLIGVAAATGAVPVQFVGLYLVLSLVTFAAYALDKSAARKGTRRTPESTLHLLSVLGGWPGALVAQQTLRHKTVKKEFRVVFWATVVLNCGALLWLLTESGERFRQGLLG